MKNTIVLRTPTRNYTVQEMAIAYEAAVLCLPDTPQAFTTDRQISEALQRSIFRMNRRYLQQQRLYATGRTVVAVFLAVLLFFGTVFTVNAEVRQVVLSWWKEVWENRVLYFWDSFIGSSETEMEYKLTYIPEGYELMESGKDETSGYVIYEGDDGGFVFEYSPASDSDGLQYFPLGDSYLHWQIDVNGLPADIYQDDYEINTYTVIQIDTQNGFVWYLDAQMDLEIMYRIIDGITLSREQALEKKAEITKF